MCFVQHQHHDTRIPKRMEGEPSSVRYMPGVCGVSISRNFRYGNTTTAVRTRSTVVQIHCPVTLPELPLPPSPPGITPTAARGGAAVGLSKPKRPGGSLRTRAVPPAGVALATAGVGRRRLEAPPLSEYNCSGEKKRPRLFQTRTNRSTKESTHPFQAQAV